MPLHPARSDEVAVVGIDFKIVDGRSAPPAGHHLGRGPAVRRANAFAFGQTAEVHIGTAVQTVDRVAVRTGDDVVLVVAAFERHARHRPFIPSRAPHPHHPAGPLLDLRAGLNGNQPRFAVEVPFVDGQVNPIGAIQIRVSNGVTNPIKRTEQFEFAGSMNAQPASPAAR